jgi:hypothetical protein
MGFSGLYEVTVVSFPILRAVVRMITIERSINGAKPSGQQLVVSNTTWPSSEGMKATLLRKAR